MCESIGHRPEGPLPKKGPKHIRTLILAKAIVIGHDFYTIIFQSSKIFKNSSSINSKEHFFSSRFLIQSSLKETVSVLYLGKTKSISNCRSLTFSPSQVMKTPFKSTRASADSKVLSLWTAAPWMRETLSECLNLMNVVSPGIETRGRKASGRDGMG